MANTLSGNVRFGRGLLSVMPTGSEYSDMLYFATDTGVVFMNGKPVTSGLLDMVYRAVSSSSGELARWDLSSNWYYDKVSLVTSSEGIFEENSIVYENGNPVRATVKEGTYIFYKKVESTPEGNVVKWKAIIISSNITPEGLQNELNELGEDVTNLQQDVSVLDASLKETDQKVDDLTEKVDTVVIPDVSGLHQDVSALQATVAEQDNTITALDGRIDTIEDILDSTNSQNSARLDRSDASINTILSNYINDGVGVDPITVDVSNNTITVGINLANNGGIKTDNSGNLTIDTDASVFDSLGSYKIEYKNGGFVLTQNGQEVADSSSILVPEDQFLEDVSIYTDPNSGVEYLSFQWKLSTGVTTPTRIPVSRLFPGVDGSTGEIVVDKSTSPWTIGIDPAFKQDVSTLQTSIEALQEDIDNIDIPEYVGVNNNSVDVSVNSNHEISAAIIWNNFTTD